MMQELKKNYPFGIRVGNDSEAISNWVREQFGINYFKTFGISSGNSASTYYFKDESSLTFFKLKFDL